MLPHDGPSSPELHVFVEQLALVMERRGELLYQLHNAAQMTLALGDQYLKNHVGDESLFGGHRRPLPAIILRPPQ